jgi:hypothetical protein
MLNDYATGSGITFSTVAIPAFWEDFMLASRGDFMVGMATSAISGRILHAQVQTLEACGFHLSVISDEISPGQGAPLGLV